MQKRLLHLLVDRTTFLALVATFVLLLVSTLSFGEAWLQWSADKYAALFNSFSDNLAGRSLQNRLCQYVPIDVVYTWVNGSDPLFRDSLKHAKEKVKHRKSVVEKCPFQDCVPSHYLTTQELLPPSMRAEFVKTQNPVFTKGLIELVDQNLVCNGGQHKDTGDGQANRTFLVMDSYESARAIVSANVSSFSVGLHTFSLSPVHWTTQWTAPNAFPSVDHMILTKLPSGATPDKILHALPALLADRVGRIWLYKEHHMAVVQVLDPDLLQTYLDGHQSLALGSGAHIVTAPAYLVVSLSQYVDGEETFATNRYADKDELRYSLRSLDKYAPWIRHVYIVTNGQIPHWLNLEHPRMSVVQHSDIFANPSQDLPTFSSPAIEANLHRIQGLSDKFLYMNDDVFLGKPVWPSDFYDETDGQKIYFSWPLPDCEPGCPNGWIKDGYCDVVCNTTNCMHDGGDCLGANPKMGFGDEDQHAFHWNDSLYDRPLCSDACLDPWLADGFCDDSCNVGECGYDAGDCGIDNYSRLYQLPSFNQEEVWSYILPCGTTVSYLNMSLLFSLYIDVALVPVEHQAVRAVSLSQRHHFLTVVLHPNISLATLNMTIQGRDMKTDQPMFHSLVVTANTTGHVVMLDQDYPDLPYQVESAQLNSQDLDLSQVDVAKLNMSQTDLQFFRVLEQQLADEEITLKGYRVKKTALVQPYVRRLNGPVESLFFDNYSTLAGSKDRKLMDAYGDSMLHVHRLYTREYGYKNRLAVTHMPHLIDRHVFEEMTEKFSQEWARTSGNRFRQPDDMQFAFSYVHYIMDERIKFNAQHVFEEYDTDGSGTWSDREIRTLLTRIHDLPIGLEHINTFEKILIDCANNLTTQGVDLHVPSTPAYERYYDSKLPIISLKLVMYCDAMVSFLESHLKDRRKYKYTLVENPDASFKTITSNVSQVVSALDDLRRYPKKFVCINDNTESSEESESDNMLVRAVLVDYLESVLPVPSSFELPPDYRNKFLHTFELETWQLYRSLLTAATYVCILLLMALAISGYYNVDIDSKVQRLFQRITGPYRRSKQLDV